MSGEQEKPKSAKSTWIQMERYLQLGILLPAATVVGWLMGEALDRWLHTHFLFIVGLLLGIAAGFVELIRVATSAESKK